MAGREAQKKYLKNALAGALVASSKPKRASAIWTTGLTVAGEASEPALDLLPALWEPSSETWVEASTSPCPSLYS